MHCLKTAQWNIYEYIKNMEVLVISVRINLLNPKHFEIQCVHELSASLLLFSRKNEWLLKTVSHCKYNGNVTGAFFRNPRWFSSPLQEHAHKKMQYTGTIKRERFWATKIVC